MENYYLDFGSWLRSQFPFRVQKISVNAGFTCPNRDGRVGYGGCIYCNNQTFNPAYCDNGKTVSEQLIDGKRFFSKKYPEMKYLAYFQAYTSTYGSNEHLKALYKEALAMEDVVGLVIGTRPDCINDELLNYFEDLSHRTFLIIEYGVETCNDKTLQLINRGHNFACSRHAIEETARRGIRVGAHIILGLPGEDAEESLRQAPIISSLPLTTLKIHQLQIIRGTRLAKMYAEEPFHLYTVDEYIQLIAQYISLLRSDLVLERFVSQSPAELLIAPHWGLKNYEFTQRLQNYLRNTRTK